MNVKKYFRVHRHDVLCASFITFQKIPKLYMWGSAERQQTQCLLTAPLARCRALCLQLAYVLKHFVYCRHLKPCNHIRGYLCVVAQATISFKHCHFKPSNTLAINDGSSIPIRERILRLILSKICVLLRHEHINVIYTIAHLLSPYYQPIHNTHHKGHDHHQHPSVHTWT